MGWEGNENEDGNGMEMGMGMGMGTRRGQEADSIIPMCSTRCE